MNSLILDTETSGLPIRNRYKYYNPKLIKYYKNSRIIEIAYNIIDNNGNVLSNYNTLIIPDNFEITNSEFHGITNEMCINKGKTIEKTLMRINDDVDKYNVKNIVSHNIEFDINILLSECYRCNSLLTNKLLKCNTYCTMLNGQEYMNVYKWPKLEQLYEYLFNKKINQEHRAKSDMEYCMECYIKMKLG